MVDPDILARKTLSLQESLADLASVSIRDASQLAENRMLRAAVERWLQVAIEAAIDIAFHVIADEEWTPAETGRGAFLILAAHGRLELGLATRLGKAASMRNLLVHDYTAIDLEQLARVAREDVVDLADFGKVVATWI